jgi:pyruvate,orthophosphate dikinase
MIVADTLEERKAALKEILPLQQKDFFGIFKAMEGRPVTIRLLDPPLHEFVPKTEEETRELAEFLKVDVAALQPKIDKLHEQNPMLGHRGCRLAVTYPEIYDMQVEAIALAAVECIRQKIPVQPEIMIPIVVTARELKLLRPNAETVLKKVFGEAGVSVPVKIGTMIEVPRAAIRSAHVARYADFFSFGTNDLTQMTFAFSRDDVASFLPSYLDQNVLDVDPFKSIDEEGVGYLIGYAVEQGRSVNPDLKCGICGEHGGDPLTIDFCYRAGLSYVSCSPFRVPLARLAAAQAVISNSISGKVKTAKKAADKKAPVKAAKKPAVKKAAPKTAKKATAKKAADKKTSVKTTKKVTAKKPAVKKAAPKTAKKAADKKTPVKTAKKTAVKKAAPKAKKTELKKTPAKRGRKPKAESAKASVKKTVKPASKTGKKPAAKTGSGTGKRGRPPKAK